MTIVVTRNAPQRFRGFLASCMLEVMAGVYIAPKMNAGVRDRIWDVLSSWAHLLDTEAGVVILWQTSETASGLAMRHIGLPKTELLNHEGVWLAHRALRDSSDTG